MFDSSFIYEDDHITGERFFGAKMANIYSMKIEQIPIFLSSIAPTLHNSFTILTHNGDYPITHNLLRAAKAIPNFRMWYGQNVECDTDPQIQSIPIGLENDIHFPHVGKRRLLFEASRRSGVVQPSKLAYLNFSMWTNPPVRYHAHSCFKEKEWVTDECLNATVQETYSYWLTQVLNHHYVFCPRGNGVDTHRTWETLYMGRIPIVLVEPNTRYYKGLPILFVEKWEDVTEQLLKESLSKLSRVSDYEMDMLKVSWWLSKIERGV